MSRQVDRLTALFVRNVSDPGQYADGRGLYLLTTNGGKRWTFLFRWQGKRCEMGLGSAGDVSLAKARTLAAQARAELAEGRNPIVVREADRVAAAAEPEPIPTFAAFADTYISAVENGWRNAKHRQQWRNSLTQHAKKLTPMSVAEIRTEDVLAVLQPIWMTKAETASRVRGRIEKVLAAAKAMGFRSADSINPATWNGHLEILLPKRQSLTRGHHAAMPYAEVPLFFRRLADRPAMAARTLEFLILTAGRSGEVFGATWKEVDLDAGIWTIPAERMKGGIAHTVTLPAAAVALLKTMGEGKPDDYVFKGQRGGSQSNMVLQMLLRRMDVTHLTVHGFRSAFKDWSLNHTEFPDEVSEEALAHVVGSRVRRAYRRGDALERRRVLMEAWAAFVTTAPAPVAMAEAA